MLTHESIWVVEPNSEHATGLRIDKADADGWELCEISCGKVVGKVYFYDSEKITLARKIRELTGDTI